MPRQNIHPPVNDYGLVTIGTGMFVGLSSSPSFQISGAKYTPPSPQPQRLTYHFPSRFAHHFRRVRGDVPYAVFDAPMEGIVARENVGAVVDALASVAGTDEQIPGVAAPHDEGGFRRPAPFALARVGEDDSAIPPMNQIVAGHAGDDVVAAVGFAGGRVVQDPLVADAG